MGEQTAEALQGKGGSPSLKGVCTFKFNLSVFLPLCLSIGHRLLTDRVLLVVGKMRHGLITLCVALGLFVPHIKMAGDMLVLPS